MHLFPHQLDLSLPFDSFNTLDLDTVDDGIEAVMFQAMENHTISRDKDTISDPTERTEGSRTGGTEGSRTGGSEGSFQESSVSGSAKRDAAATTTTTTTPTTTTTTTTTTTDTTTAFGTAGTNIAFVLHTLIYFVL